MAKTISDIAQMAGVTKSTVSRFLNGGPIAEATRKKLEKIIDETGYIPNSFAQSLKAKQTSFVGVIVPRLDSIAASKTLIGIDEKLKTLDYQMIISHTSKDINREVESIYSLANQKIAGLILLASKITPAHMEAFAKVNIPVLLVGLEHEKLYSLIYNDYNSGYDIGNCIVQKGHKRIAYLGAREKDLIIGRQRVDGVLKAVNEHGGCTFKQFETTFKIQDAQKKAEAIIDEFNPTIIVCATDKIALGVLKAAHMKGLKIPDDLSITGFGGHDITESIHPGLTTIQFHYKAAGEKAAEKIVSLIQRKPVPFCTVSNYKLVERESVKDLTKVNQQDKDIASV
ncbi:LacI family sucrose operon transcriptional repressor [Bacillus ectoiniformans]|uniref:LacI family DNA-binding transcriptional regulator n=1 Tax=Bacillus ectoiniformans TaxID=1494429 RepID=UPI00195EC34F|nr:LacI family DNA-binding transcriptional regulator [Bacillus ectoiniformans]MBM7647781.1 LacI family sucrose operon transcriptional repressor [Bacillus ectoiniformans]